MGCQWKKVSPIAAIFFSLISLTVLIICEIFRFDQPNDKDVILLTRIAIILSWIPAVIATTVLHYRCWKAVPAEFARTAPGVAVGLLFVPFFHFYWYFVSYAGLAEDCAKALDSNGSARGLGITLGILSITGWTPLPLIPLISIPLGITYFVVWLLYTLKMVAGANTLIGREAPQGRHT
jgi:hypothetical protein